MTTAAAWQIIVVTLAGWLNREQQLVIDYLVAENEILKEHLGDRRIRLGADLLGRPEKA